MTGPSAHAEPTGDDGLKPESTGPCSEGAPTSVLLVDDDARVLKAIRETIDLEPDLFVVGEAGDAATAYTLAAATDPAVVLVDVLLPDSATGMALVAALSRRPHCSVVAMSMRGATRASALAAGAVAFVEKGSDIDALLVVLRDAASQLC
jgi:DNA-binding NarL/FixJ family response regulator